MTKEGQKVGQPCSRTPDNFKKPTVASCSWWPSKPERIVLGEIIFEENLHWGKYVDLFGWPPSENATCLTTTDFNTVWYLQWFINGAGTLGEQSSCLWISFCHNCTNVEPLGQQTICGLLPYANELSQKPWEAKNQSTTLKLKLKNWDCIPSLYCMYEQTHIGGHQGWGLPQPAAECDWGPCRFTALIYHDESSY